MKYDVAIGIYIYAFICGKYTLHRHTLHSHNNWINVALVTCASHIQSTDILNFNDVKNDWKYSQFIAKWNDNRQFTVEAIILVATSIFVAFIVLWKMKKTKLLKEPLKTAFANCLIQWNWNVMDRRFIAEFSLPWIINIIRIICCISPEIICLHAQSTNILLCVCVYLIYHQIFM